MSDELLQRPRGTSMSTNFTPMDLARISSPKYSGYREVCRNAVRGYPSFGQMLHVGSIAFTVKPAPFTPYTLFLSMPLMEKSLARSCLKSSTSLVIPVAAYACASPSGRFRFLGDSLLRSGRIICHQSAVEVERLYRTVRSLRGRGRHIL